MIVARAFVLNDKLVSEFFTFVAEISEILTLQIREARVLEDRSRYISQSLYQENHLKASPSCQRHVAGAIILIWKQALLSAGYQLK